MDNPIWRGVGKVAPLVTSIAGILAILANSENLPLYVTCSLLAVLLLIGLAGLAFDLGPWIRRVLRRKPRFARHLPVAQDALENASPDLIWYTLDLFQCWAVTDVQEKGENRERCRTLAAQLHAASANAGLTQWISARDEVATALRTWLVSRHGMTSKEAGQTAVSTIICLLNEVGHENGP